ncbi:MULTISPECIES: matrixin family metalloprotease [Streptomyces]|uniref:Matrixin family metalloprotease n=1 Tax=Streptomyces achmelvichensis TaxID=3134111 RepID=A0ACC6PMS4_9ACTN|nr:matrixin family metalloprotease [Streptomyces sp. NBC_00306]
MDNNPGTVQIAATAGNAYQRRGDGSIWKYTGTLDVWEELDTDSALESIAAGGGSLYKLRNDGSLFKAGSLAHLLAFDAGTCETGFGTTDQDELYGYRDGAGPADVVIYIVRSIMTDTGPLSGCAQQLPFHQPGLVVESTAPDWVIAHEVGHVLGLDHVADTDALMDGSSALFTNPPPNVASTESVSMIGSKLTSPCGDWTLLDWNASTSNITASTTDLYQLRADGSVWRYIGPPITGWTKLDSSSAGAQQLAADAGRLFLLSGDGNVYETFDFVFTSHSKPLDDAARTLQIAASGGQLYQRSNDGSVLRYSGTPLIWEALDVNPPAGSLSQNAEIVADGTLLYKRDTGGRMYRYEGTSPGGWLILADKDTIAIAAGGGNLYQLRGAAGVWQYTGTPLTGWKQLDNNPATRDIIAVGADLFQRHVDGNLFQHTGGTSWAALDDSPATVQFVAAGGRLYQRHIAGFIWKKL